MRDNSINMSQVFMNRFLRSLSKNVRRELRVATSPDFTSIKAEMLIFEISSTMLDPQNFHSYDNNETTATRSNSSGEQDSCASTGNAHISRFLESAACLFNNSLVEASCRARNASINTRTCTRLFRSSSRYTARNRCRWVDSR